jgi:hypothetical protein
MVSHGTVAAEDMVDISTVLSSVYSSTIFYGFEEGIETGIYGLEMITFPPFQSHLN